MIGLIFGDTAFPNEILKKIKKKKINYLIIDLSSSKKFKKCSIKNLNKSPSMDGLFYAVNFIRQINLQIKQKTNNAPHYLAE